MEEVKRIQKAANERRVRENPNRKISLQSKNANVDGLKNWKYEEEYRSIYSKNQSNPRMTISDNMYLLNAGNIKTIYLGCKVSEDEENIVRDLAGNIPVVKMKESDKEYKVEPSR